MCFLYVYVDNDVDKLPDVWTTFLLEVLLYQEMYEARSALQAVSCGIFVGHVLYLPVLLLSYSWLLTRKVRQPC